MEISTFNEDTFLKDDTTLILNQIRKNPSRISTGVALLLVAMLLVPMGLKLEHTLSFHSKVDECTHSKTHIHAESSHDDLLDGFFQPLVHTSFESFTLKKPILDQEIFKVYQSAFYLKHYKGLGLRAPPRSCAYIGLLAYAIRF